MTLNKTSKRKFKKDFAPMIPHALGQSDIELIFIRLWLRPMGYTEIKPEDCGALTSAPLITDGKDVWGYMDYQVKSFLEELLDWKTITWQKG